METPTINKQLFFPPDAALLGIVNNIMIGQTHTPASTGILSFPFPPLPEHSILFYPHDRPMVEDVTTGQVRALYACTVTGPQTERTILTLGKRHLMIKIGFQPGALYRLLGLPMNMMLKDKDYDGESIFGSGVRSFLDAFASATDFCTMKRIADDFMFTHLTKIKKPSSIDYVIPEIIRHGGMIRIDSLVKQACLSNRQFERAFKDRMGVSPKFYSRLVRFGKAWLMKENNPGITWTKVAYECSYFDQMHLIRDFKTFANTNPKEIATSFEKQPFLLVKRIFH